MRTDPTGSLAVPSEVARHSYFRSRLLAEIPDLDAETLADTLEGMTDLKEMLGEVIRSALDDEALAAGLMLRMGDMKARLERLSTRAKRKRSLVLNAMTEAQIPKLTQPDFSASLRHGTVTLEIEAEDRIPPDWWKPQPPKLDRQGLLVALKSGAMIEGAFLAPPQLQLSVRAK